MRSLQSAEGKGLGAREGRRERGGRKSNLQTRYLPWTGNRTRDPVEGLTTEPSVQGGTGSFQQTRLDLVPSSLAHFRGTALENVCPVALPFLPSPVWKALPDDLRPVPELASHPLPTRAGLHPHRGRPAGPQNAPRARHSALSPNPPQTGLRGAARASAPPLHRTAGPRHALGLSTAFLALSRHEQFLRFLTPSPSPVRGTQ